MERRGYEDQRTEPQIFTLVLSSRRLAPHNRVVRGDLLPVRRIPAPTGRGRRPTPLHAGAYRGVHRRPRSRRLEAVLGQKVSALSSLGTFGTRTKDAEGRYDLVENPVSRVYRPKRQKPAERYLYAHEIKQLLAVQADAPSRLVLELLIDTALRASEVCRANVADLTEDGGRLRLAVVVKGGRPRTITLGQRVGALLLESLRLREAKPGDPLIVGPHGGRLGRTSLSELVRRLAVKAGVTRVAVRAHVLRHSMASLASAANVDIPTIAAMPNHSDLNTVTRYVHRHDAVDAAREKMREMLRGEAGLTFGDGIVVLCGVA